MTIFRLQWLKTICLDQILENYNVQEDCTIIIFVRLRGGMIF